LIMASLRKLPSGAVLGHCARLPARPAARPSAETVHGNPILLCSQLLLVPSSHAAVPNEHHTSREHSRKAMVSMTPTPVDPVPHIPFDPPAELRRPPGTRHR
jgi:hypothetical protein